MKPIIDAVKPYKKYLVFALILAAINQIFSLLDPQIFRLIIDDYIMVHGELEQNEFIRGVGLLILLAIFVAFISRTAKVFQSYFVNVIKHRAGASLYERAVSHTFSLPYKVFEDRRSGEILQKLQKARQDMENLIEGFINVIFLSAVGILFVVVYAYTVNWIIGSLFLLLIPILGFIAYYISRKIKDAQKNIVRQISDLSGSTTETLRNVELVKSLGLEDQEINRLNENNNRLLLFEIEKVKIFRKVDFIQGTTVNALRSLILLTMFILIYFGAMSVGEFFTLLFYSFFVFNPLMQFGSVASYYHEAKASSEELEEILSMKSEPKPKNAVEINNVDSVKFKEVSFSYGNGDVLKGVSLNFLSGKTIGLAGASGSGKSTIVKLLIGLYKQKSGKITVNDVDNQKVDFDLFRKKIGFVAQETQLFSGSIRDNLLFVNPGASDLDCLAVLEAAEISHLVKRSKLGLDTVIGEAGIKLSGGEKQRLAIARALIRNPDIIIFDEATSSLDSKTEEKIVKTISNIRKKNPGMIIVQVAHRLSTLINSDIIYVLENGKVVESGKHSSLIKDKGLYYAFWRQQQGGRLS
ncbi:MAG: ABC transporter ATP-binding protein [Candidatus Woesearchaeota archaeon]